MKKIIILLFFVIVNTSFGDRYFTSVADQTIYFRAVEKDTFFINNGSSIFRLKQGNTFLQFYPSGDLREKSDIIASVSNPEANCTYQYMRHGSFSRFYNFTNKAKKTTGFYEYDTPVGSWTHYSKSGNIVQQDYPIDYPLLQCRRSDYFDKSGNIIRQIDRIITIEDTIQVREVLFDGDQETLIEEIHIIAVLIKRFSGIYMFMLLFFNIARYIVNSAVYNRENNTNLPLIYWGIGFSSDDTFYHTRVCMMTFWFFHYKPENKKLVRLSELFSLLFIGSVLLLFLG